MKELSIEEKAKRYDEAIEKARYWEKNPTVWSSDDICQKLFPELKESEDEKIRKALIGGFNVMKESKNCGKTFSNHNIPVADILAWLEKQGTPAKLSEEEQNKFVKGVLMGCAISFINYLNAHAFDSKMLCVSNREYEDIENAFQNSMWGRLHRYYCKYIEKQDEVVVDKELSDLLNKVICHFINEPNIPYSERDEVSKKIIPYVKQLEKQGEQKPAEVRTTGYWNVQDIEQKPADKVEPKKEDTSELTPFEAELFSMMSDAWQGYQLGEEVNIAEIVKEHSSELLEKANKQNRAWSEEDEIAFGDALWCCKQAASIAKDENEMGNVWYAENWLKSIKDRYTWKPSDRQMKAIEHICDGNYNVDLDILDSIYKDFKKLRE